MHPTRRGQSLRPIAAVALLFVGIAAFGLWRVLGSTEELPYRTDAEIAPSSAVTLDAQYSLAVPGGVQAMLDHGVPIAGGDAGVETINLQCTYTAGGEANQTLAVSAASIDTKATNTVGTFVSPISGRISVQCSGWGSMFIPDADDAPADNAGTALLVGTIAITIGLCLGLSVLYSGWSRRAASAAAGRSGDDDEVEALVDVARPVPYQREIVDTYPRDVGE